MKKILFTVAALCMAATAAHSELRLSQSCMVDTMPATLVQNGFSVMFVPYDMNRLPPAANSAGASNIRNLIVTPAFRYFGASLYGGNFQANYVRLTLIPTDWTSTPASD